VSVHTASLYICDEDFDTDTDEAAEEAAGDHYEQAQPATAKSVSWYLAMIMLLLSPVGINTSVSNVCRS